MEGPNIQLSAEFEKINYNTPLIQAIQSVVINDSKSSNYHEKSFPLKTVSKISQLLSSISSKQVTNMAENNNNSKSNNMNDNTQNTNDLLGPRELFMNIYKKNEESPKKLKMINLTPLDAVKAHIDLNWELMTDRWFQDNKVFMPCNRKFENIDETIGIISPQMILPNPNSNLTHEKTISMTQISYRSMSEFDKKNNPKITNITLTNGGNQQSKGNKVSTIIAPGDGVKANSNNILYSSSAQNKGGVIANFGPKLVHISQDVKAMTDKNEEISKLVQTDKPINAQNIDLIKTEEETQENLRKNKNDNKKEKKKKDKVIKEKKKNRLNSEPLEENIGEIVKENPDPQPQPPAS